MEFLSQDQVTGQSLQIGFVRLSVLQNLSNILWEGNSKLHDLDEIYQSICEYGFVDYPLWDSNLNEGRGGLVYGNGRAEALVLGLQKAAKAKLPRPRGIVEAKDDQEWCIPVEFGMDQMNELKAIGLAIAHNNSTLGGGRGMDALTAAMMWDEDRYLATLENLYAEDALPVTVDEDDYGYLMANLRKIEEEEDPENDGSGSGKEKEETVCRVDLGDVWKLGRHRLLCGDSTDPAILVMFKKLIDFPDAKIIWTDPPYGVSYESTNASGVPVGSEKIENDDLKEDELLEFLINAFDVITLAGAPGAPIYCFSPQAELSFIFYRAMTHASIRIKQQLIWVKNHFALSRSDYHYKHECLYYGVLPGDWVGEKSWNGGRDKTSIFQYDKPLASKLHPTMKPIDLIKEMLENSAKKGDTVFDPFLGSGSTLIAAETLGLRLFGYELNPNYASVIIDRWEELTGMTAEKIGSLAEMCTIEEY